MQRNVCVLIPLFGGVVLWREEAGDIDVDIRLNPLIWRGSALAGKGAPALLYLSLNPLIWRGSALASMVLQRAQQQMS